MLTDRKTDFLQQKVLNFIILISVLLCFSSAGIAESGTLNDYNPYDVNIPDNGSPVNSDLALSSAPSGATITKVKVYYEIRHPYIGDLKVWLTTYYSGAWHDYILKNREGGSSDNIIETRDNLTAWNGASPNQTWYLVAQDMATGNIGYIDFFELWATYSVNDPPNAPSIENPTYQETGVSVNSGLNWSCTDPNNDTLYYTVYLGKNDPSPGVVIKTDQTGSFASLPTLDYSSHYYWQVKADDHNGGVTWGPVWDFYTESVGSLEVTVRNINGTAIQNAKVVRYNPDGGTTSETTDSSGKVVWENIMTGNYSLEAYYAGTIFGEEYWGDKIATVNADQTTTKTLDRIYPYAELVTTWNEDTGVQLNPTDNISLGTRVRVEVTVRNKVSQSLDVKVRLLLDRDQAAAFDSDQTSDSQAIGSNSTKKFTFYYTVNDASTWYSAIEVKTTLLNGNTTNTDAWPWKQAFRIINVALTRSVFSKARYFKGESVSAAFTFTNGASTDFKGAHIEVYFRDPRGLTVGGASSTMFTIDGNSSFTTSSSTIWTIPTSGSSGAYIPIVTLFDRTNSPVATYEPVQGSSVLPVLPIGNFPRLNNLIVKSQFQFSATDSASVYNVLKSFKNAGLTRLTVSLKLDDEQGYWSSLGVMPGDVLFSAKHALPSARNPLYYDLNAELQNSATKLGIVISQWMPAFYDHAVLADHPEWEMASDPNNEHYIDPCLEDVRTYEGSIVLDACSTPYQPPETVYLDYFRFTSLDSQNENGSDCIEEYVHSVRQSLPAQTKLAGYMFPFSETHWSGQDYAQLQPYLDQYSPMLYWQGGAKPSSQETLPAAIGTYYDQKIGEIRAHLGDEFVLTKVVPALRIEYGIVLSDNSSVNLTRLEWQVAQVDALGALADNGVSAYDMFFWGTWDSFDPTVGNWMEAVADLSSLGPNSAPIDIGLSNYTVAEIQSFGTTVGTFSTTDPDAGNTFTYTLVSGAGSMDNGSFMIIGNTLQTAASFNYEAKNSYSVRVRTTDQGGLWYEKILTITVTDVVEALKGDINNDGIVNLKDAILALRVLAGFQLQESINLNADVNGDGKIGLEEITYILQKTGEMTP